MEEVINGNEDCLAKCEWATSENMDGKDGWMDGWDGWTDGRMDEQTVVYGRVGIARERKYYVWTKSKCIHRRRPFRLTN